MSLMAQCLSCKWPDGFHSPRCPETGATRRLKLMVIGHARHGKDSVCALLREFYGYSFVSSSMFVADKAVKPFLAARGVTYDNFGAMYADRVNHRAAWFEAIASYNREDPARMGKELFAQHDIYCGIRNKVEFNALRRERAFDVAFWVDASSRLPSESADSNTMSRSDADFVIDNNGAESELPHEVFVAHTKALARLGMN